MTDGLYMEQPVEGIGLDPFLHASKEIEAFTFIFDQRIFLTVTTKTYAIPQTIHAKETILPMVLDDPEHERFIQKVQQVRSQFLLLLRISFPHMASDLLQPRVASDVSQ